MAARVDAPVTGHGVDPGTDRPVPRSHRRRPDVPAVPPDRVLRRSEACGLRWPDVDVGTGKLSITHGHRPAGLAGCRVHPEDRRIRRDRLARQGHRRRAQSLRKRQLAERLRWGAAWTDTGHVFTAERGGPLHPDRITDIFEWAAFKADLPPIRLHDLRHGAASIAHAAGADMKAISHMLRHASQPITADIYTSVFEEADAELAEQMSRLDRERGRSATRTRLMDPRRPHIGPDGCQARPRLGCLRWSEGGASGARTRNPRIKSPLLYH
jgi:hypothetical protein